jgi:signal transduction histidine kinase
MVQPVQMVQPVRAIVLYTASVISGAALAILAASYGARDNVYVMFAVLLVVSVALTSGTGPALAAAVTSVVGDDLILSGRLPALDRWKDVSVFAIVAIIVGWLVASKRAQQIEAERLARREHELRTERDAILAAISHDVKNPLAVIQGSARHGIAGGEQTGDTVRLFRRIDAAALQAAYLIDVLSDVHSLDGNEIRLDLRRGDLRHAAEKAVDQMGALAPRHTLCYSAPATPVMAEYDEGRIQRVLQNVLGNAVKYSPDGGSIDIELRASPTEAYIGIRDHGVGIPAADRPHVFERGYRASTAGAIPGTGLGLFISAEIVKLHGGRITCLAPPDGGTLVELRIPLGGVGLPSEFPEQLPRHGSGPAIADRSVVHRDNGNGLPRRAGEKRLVGAE